MEDVIDELRASAQTVPVPLELPSEDALVVVEEELLLPIPRDMREYLLLASDVIYGSVEPVTAADPSAHTYLPEVAAVAWAQGLPRYLVPLCERHGQYYCVDPEGKVLFWREGEITDQSWENVWYWVRDVWLES